MDLYYLKEEFVVQMTVGEIKIVKSKQARYTNKNESSCCVDYEIPEQCKRPWLHPQALGVGWVNIYSFRVPSTV